MTSTADMMTEAAAHRRLGDYAMGCAARAARRGQRWRADQHMAESARQHAIACDLECRAAVQARAV